MDLISREDLLLMMDRGDDFKLVNVLGDWAFKAKHIPGSINLSTPAKADELLVKDDNIVVHCAGGDCPSSKYAFMMLKKAGYQNVRRYAGGLADWEDAGMPLEGDMVEEETKASNVT